MVCDLHDPVHGCPRQIMAVNHLTVRTGWFNEGLQINMLEKDVPDDVGEFIIKHIVSVAQCEALLLIASRPDEQWSLRRIANRIYASDKETALSLNQLCSDGLLTCSDGYYSLTRSAETIEMLGKLREAYARYLIQVTNVIHNKSPKTNRWSECISDGEAS